jgi:hypothetical protein
MDAHLPADRRKQGEKGFARAYTLLRENGVNGILRKIEGP